MLKTAEWKQGIGRRAKQIQSKTSFSGLNSIYEWILKTSGSVCSGSLTRDLSVNLSR